MTSDEEMHPENERTHFIEKVTNIFHPKIIDWDSKQGRFQSNILLLRVQ